MSNETEVFPSQKEFEKAVDAQTDVEELASKGDLTHEDLFDETGHVSEGIGDIAVAIVDGKSVLPTDSREKEEFLDVLSSKRSEDTDADHDAALAEHPYRVEESSLRVAAKTLDEARQKVAEVDQASPFPETNPTSGSAEDRKLAGRLPDAVRQVAQEHAERTAKEASKNATSQSVSADTYLPQKAGDATGKVLQDVMRREPQGFFGRLKGLFRKQLSRTDRVVEGVDRAAQKAGARAQQAGEAVRTEQEKAAAAERDKNPF